MSLDDWFILSSTLFFLFITAVYLILFFENRGQALSDPAPKRFPLVSVVIPAFNEEDTIAGTIRSVLALDYPKKIEVLVVDDGSTDRTAVLAKQFKGVLVFSKPNGGKGSALNHGIRKAKGELVATVDADSFVRPDALRQMMGYFADERVGAVSSSILVHEPRNILQGIQFVEYIGMNYIRKNNDFLDSLFVTPGPLSVFRKSALIKVGLFDEHALSEDMEVALKLLTNGYRIKHSVNALVTSVSPHSLGELFKQRIRWYRGALMNGRKYAFLFFNPAYRNLGLFVFPINFIIFGILAVLLTRGAVITLGGIPLAWDKLVHLLALKGTSQASYVGSLLNPIYFATIGNFFLVVSLAFFIAYFSVSFSLSREKFRWVYVPFLVLYLTVWNILIGLAFFVGLFRELGGVSRKW